MRSNFHYNGDYDLFTDAFELADAALCASLHVKDVSARAHYAEAAADWSGIALSLKTSRKVQS